MRRLRDTIRIGIAALVPWVVAGCGSTSTELGGDGKSTQWLSQGESSGFAGGDGVDSSPTPREGSYRPEQFFASHSTSEIDSERLAEIQREYRSDVAGITFESSPEDVSRVFVGLLHGEDFVTAERLLTLAARAIIHESGLELAPIAGPNAEYSFGDAYYATSSRERAFVDCVVRDPELAVDGEAATYKVTWALRPESHYGWRVYGMVSEESGQPQMVSFESPQHALAIGQLYDELDGQQGATVRQANETSQGKLR